MTEYPILGILLSTAVLLRWCTSYHPYSGQGKPPMFGDYEAQRHWQEITLHLPMGDWYRNTSKNDLNYWGLDYPPLTAYHSYLLGILANSSNPSFVDLGTSRGFESIDHKLFMRISVLITDLLLYFPGILLFFWDSNPQKSIFGLKKTSFDHQNSIFGIKKHHSSIFSALIYPGIILIDHGHFQYNSVSLGFFILAVFSIINDWIGLGSFFFVLGLNYKQMELYHSLPFFFYILGICLRQKSVVEGLKLLIKTGIIVLGTFFIVWAPFLGNGTYFDVLKRLFPVDRGLFEDKVANVWCSVNVLVKLKTLFSSEELFKYSLKATVTTIFASNLDLLFRPTKTKFLVSLINTSLGFYLFSFQVHEKSILLVAIPVLLFFEKDPFFCFWFLIVSCFSMVPLFIKDGLFVAYCGLMVFYFTAVLGVFPGLFEVERGFWGILRKFGFFCSIFGGIVLSFVSVFGEPPERYPDLFPLGVSVYSCAHFCAFLVYFNVKQLLGGKELK